MIRSDGGKAGRGGQKFWHPPGRLLGQALGQVSGVFLRLTRPIAQLVPRRIFILGGCQLFCPPRGRVDRPWTTGTYLSVR